MTAVLIEQYGGAASRISPDATAFSQRQAQYDLGILAQWADRSDSDRHVAWTRAFASAMTPHSAGGYLLNFLGEEGDGHDQSRLRRQLRPPGRGEDEVRPIELLQGESERLTEMRGSKVRRVREVRRMRVRAFSSVRRFGVLTRTPNPNPNLEP